MKLFVVKDMKAQLHLRPFFNANSAEAVRGWEMAANEAESMISKFPHDFRLLELGQFNEVTGLLTQYDQPVDLGSAADFKRKNSSDIPLFKSAQ